MREELPRGTVTFLFTDVEGSTRLLDELGAEAYAAALAEHRRLIRDACARHGGVEVDTQGDAFFFAFPSAPGALTAAQAATEALAGGPIQVRIGLHTGTPLVTEEGYVGDDVHFAARVAAASHGGQVVLSRATREQLDEDVALSDLGEHRLKDIPKAVSIFQLGAGSFPPLKTISNTNLPRPASSFVGRERELREVLDRVQAGGRLVTLTGPGGSGKTRLALEAAATLVPEYKAGVFWVGLAALRDPALVTETIAQTLGAKNSLQEHIGERELLLLLDNLEQVVEAAPDLSVLVSSCPNLALLMTSRELLRVQGEVEYAVPPLVEPEAVSLFCERAQLEPSEEIAELCVRLDNLPLAVELAAARTKALAPAQILERLSQRLDFLKGGRDTDPRQQTLRATIDWSYDLLSEEEQRLFRALSVFAGGCTLEAAAEVCDADLDTLQSLLEKSLLRFSEGRYWMLETIREHAAERLQAAGEAEAGRRYVEHFANLVSRLGGEHVWLTANADVMERLDVESANFRDVLQRMVDHREGERMLEVASGLAPYWLARGQFHEGLTWVEAALTVVAAEDSELRGRALSGAADLSWALGELDRARAHATESLEVAERLGEPLAIAQALHDLGEIAAQEEDFEQAKTLYEQAILRAREADYPAPGSIGNLANVALAEGDYDRARELLSQAAQIFRDSENHLGYATSLFNLSCAALYGGHLDEARSFLRESLGLCADLRYSALGVIGLHSCAAILARTHRPLEAARLLGAGETLLREMGSTLEPPERRMHEETRVLVGAALDDSEMAVAWESGRALSMDDALSFALDTLDSIGRATSSPPTPA